MNSLRVHWSEGLFLQPQHFQAAERSWAETLQTSELWDHHYGYGIRRLELSADAIANYQFQVNVCHARMKDGTLVSLDPGQGLDRLDLKEAFARESVVRVYLAVPKLKIGVANVRSEGQSTKARYVEVVQSVQDESTGGNDQEVRFRMLDMRLLLSTQDMAGYEVLPLAQIQRAAEQEAAPVIDDNYFPPMLAIDAWPPLGRDMVRAIYDILGKKIEVLSEQVINRGISLVSQEPGDLDRLFMLNELNAAYSVLQVLAFAGGIHPLWAYTELCRLVGRLALFSQERRPPDIPVYDHDDLATIFHKIKDWIVLVLGRVRDYEYEQRFFVGEGKSMRRVAGIEVAGQRLAVVHRRALRQPERAGLPGAAAARGAQLEAGQRAAGRFPLSIRRRGAAHAAVGAGAAGPAAAARLALLRGQPRQHRLARRAGDADPGHAAHRQPDRQSRQAARRAEHRRRRRRQARQFAVRPVRRSASGKP